MIDENKYLLNKEFFYKKNWYYKTECGKLVKLKSNVPLPYNPIVDLKYSNKEFFEIIKVIPEGLERLIK